MISSELPEVLGMSDRILVMREGRIVAEFDRAEADTGDGRRSDDGRPAPTRRGRRERRPAIAPRRRAPAAARLRLARATARRPSARGADRRSCVVVGLFNPRFLADAQPRRPSSLGNAYIAVAAIGMSMVIISGNIDVSVGSLIGVLATISGIARGRGLCRSWSPGSAPVLVGIAAS